MVKNEKKEGKTNDFHSIIGILLAIFCSVLYVKVVPRKIPSMRNRP
jgi:hypothetical protein